MLRRIHLLMLALILQSFKAHAVPENFVCPEGFTCPDPVLAKTDFWIKLFAVYDENQAIFYDAYNPQVTYNIISGHNCRNKKDQVILNEKSRIRRVLGQIAAKKRMGMTNWTVEETSMLQITSVKEDFDHGFAAEPDNLQCDNGLRNKFFTALERCSGYSDDIISHLQNEELPRKLPLDLKYLPLSESLCNPYAGSNAGARGMWQFIPLTAKSHRLKMNAYVDERRDFHASTAAAARYLSSAFKTIETKAIGMGFEADSTLVSPLALTSYNCGVGGMCVAMGKNNGIDYSIVIENHHGNGFGDAVKNYLASFFAVYHVAKNPEAYYNEPIVPLSLGSTQIIALHKPTKISTIVETLVLDKQRLKDLNPKFTDGIWNGTYSIPASYTIEIPLLPDCEHEVKALGKVKQTFYRREKINISPIEPKAAMFNLVRTEPEVLRPVAPLMVPEAPKKRARFWRL